MGRRRKSFVSRYGDGWERDWARLGVREPCGGWTGRGVWIAALAFLAWLLPPNRRTLKGTWAAQGLTLPLALAAIAPLAWQKHARRNLLRHRRRDRPVDLRAAGEGLASAWPSMKTKAFWMRSLTKRAEG